MSGVSAATVHELRGQPVSPPLVLPWAGEPLRGIMRATLRAWRSRGRKGVDEKPTSPRQRKRVGALAQQATAGSETDDDLGLQSR